MREDVVTVSLQTTLSEAIRTMLKEKTNAVLILDGGSLKGILTSWKIIEQIVPDYLEEDKHLASFEDHELFERRVHELAEKHVADFMTTDLITVKPTASLIEAATLISEHHIRQLPVVDASGKLTGYINHTDLKRAMGTVLNFDKELLV